MQLLNYYIDFKSICEDHQLESADIYPNDRLKLEEILNRFIDENKQQKSDNSKEIRKIIHQFDEENDRWIYIEFDNNNEIIGLNFMQDDDYELFQKEYCYNDEKLMRFYDRALADNFFHGSKIIATLWPIIKKDIEFINTCMSDYLEQKLKR